MSDKYRRKPFINFYKPQKKEGAGSAFQFSFDASKRAIYLEATRQQGGFNLGAKDQFDWENKIVFKIGVADIGKMLLLFSMRKKEITCLHSQESDDGKRVSVLEIKVGEYKGEPNFGVKLSKTVGGETNFVSMYMNQEELALLAHFMREALTRMFGFGEDGKGCCSRESGNQDRD
jgi:hypothetical protein